MQFKGHIMGNVCGGAYASAQVGDGLAGSLKAEIGGLWFSQGRQPGKGSEGSRQGGGGS